MKLTPPTLADLFAQLGLESDEGAIGDFVSAHRPLANQVALADAPFWTPTQQRFLREEILEDADWAEVIDQLNVMLHD